ncbi:MAG: deoxyguanosinetriphosphate triphosphohydrolase, partial [Gammaproteobacteria bacterium]
EHNLQSLRVVDELEERYAEFRGLNLTFEAREGILKHCAPAKAKELGELGQRFLNRQQPGLEAQLANVADEIAYNNHDVDDGLRAGLISVEQLRGLHLFREQYDAVMQRYPHLSGRRLIHETVRRMINRQVTDLVEASRERLAAVAPADGAAVRAHAAPLIGFSDVMREHNLELKRFLRRQLYQHYKVKRMSAKAQRVIRTLFDVFMEDPALLPPEFSGHTRSLEEALGTAGRARGVSDYVAGMTDRYAITEYERVFNPAQLT